MAIKSPLHLIPFCRPELDEVNQSAAKSFREDLDQVLTLHRLGVFALVGRSFKTTNCLENVNALVEDRCARPCSANSRLESPPALRPGRRSV